MNDLISLAQKIDLQPANSGGGGHDTTFAALCWAWRNSSDFGDIAEFANWYNAVLCHPAWGERDLIHKIESANKTVMAAGELGKYEPKHPRAATPYHAPYTPPSAPVAQKPPPNLSALATGCHDALLRGNHKKSSEYLTARGITTQTIVGYRLGGCQDAHYGFGVTMPYTNRAGSITAVNRRWLSPPVGGSKTTYVAGSKVGGALFGGHLPPTPIIGIVEGEINAASVYQVSGYSCYGIGSESNWRNSDTLQWLKALASGARKVLIWLDKEKIATALMQELGGKCIVFSSNRAGAAVGIDGKLDANDLLRHGVLGQVLAAVGVLESSVAIDNVVVAIDNVTESPVENAVGIPPIDYAHYRQRAAELLATRPTPEQFETFLVDISQRVAASEQRDDLLAWLQCQYLAQLDRVAADSRDWTKDIAAWEKCMAERGLLP